MRQLVAPRLFPKIPPRRYLSFYPMSKRRGEQVNWYDLPPEARAELMRGHGEIGRKSAGRVTQVIAGSVGLDDWEWGVTLFADDPLVFKKLVHEMRFDPASSRYALFGPFYLGIRFAAGGLGGGPRTGGARAARSRPAPGAPPPPAPGRGALLLRRARGRGPGPRPRGGLRRRAPTHARHHPRACSWRSAAASASSPG